MHPELLHKEFTHIIQNISHSPTEPEEHSVSLNEHQIFQMWNSLGEELGIDLALATKEQREMLFRQCKQGCALKLKDFGSLLWLIYYGSEVHPCCRKVKLC